MNNMHDDGLVGNYAAEENDCSGRTGMRKSLMAKVKCWQVSRSINNNHLDADWIGPPQLLGTLDPPSSGLIHSVCDYHFTWVRNPSSSIAHTRTSIEIIFRR